MNSKWEIKCYTDRHREEWNRFIKDSRNSTFLFDRDFMEYHSDRFHDCSLLAFRKGKLRAVLAADLTGNVLRSHGGLTYGGWILAPNTGINTSEVLELWKEWTEWCERHSFSTIVYKPLPYIYTLQPSQEDEYCLFRCDARLTEVDVSTTILLDSNPGLNKLQKRHLKSLDGIRFNIKKFRGEIPTEVLKDFHDMLSDCLRERHDAKPVHSADEIALLSERFPDNISLNVIEKEGKIEAGIWMFETSVCNHCQYIATTPTGRDMNLLTPLTVRLIEESKVEGKRYFDFGISTEEHGRVLNDGLLRHKSSLGGSAVSYTHWEIDVATAVRRLRF